jgi:ACS family glucarate transporter-like MFS transporter
MGGIIADALARVTGIKWSRRIVGSGAFFLGASGFVLAIYARSPEAAIASLVLASGAHDLTLPVLWASCVDVGGRFGGTASGYMNFASCISGMVAPIAAARLFQAFGSFTGVFLVAASIYIVGGLLWFLIDPRESLKNASN